MVITIKGRAYEVPFTDTQAWLASGVAHVVLPDGRVMAVARWIETDPPTPQLTPSRRLRPDTRAVRATEA